VPPHWRRRPAAAVFGQLAETDAVAAREACRLNARLIAAELRDLSIDIDCLPCLDLRTPESHDAIGDRSFGYDAGLVAELGRAAADGLLAGGVLPVIKHMPGHGRARVDSHETLPVIEADEATLSETDFAPFRALADLPLAMTGHLLLAAVDAGAPATASATVIDRIIRERIGFDGLLLTDDISMQALRGNVGERSAAALVAGCDMVLHCNGDMGEMRAVADRVGPLDGDSAARASRALAWRRTPEDFDAEVAERRLEGLLRPVTETL
jgi:beta-N-acetylhexosaminidase